MSEEKKKYFFEKLTPISDGELGIYESAIDFVFENEDIKNVAISGAYGAGKSSVLSTYKERHDNIKFIHISLAHFESAQSGKSNEVIRESVLEGKILNQLLHQIPPNKIPQTNFRVKTAVKPCKIFGYTLATMALVLAILHVAFYNAWKNFVETIGVACIKSLLILTTNSTAALISGIVAVVLAAFFVFQMIKLQENKNIFRKLSVQGNEIEIFEETDDSYFDKYLNEVLYLFGNVEADVIVFEDMDRFDANRIFERLREINILTNLQRKKNGTKNLRFFYLLKDDIFVSKDRTKFFDYIIPVVPVVDGSNSYDQFISHLKKNDLYKKFDEGFLQGLSLYVDDMRLLKNICNEFLIYYNRLNTTELDYNKMLAIITYKNLFPRDFSDLQLGKGFVYALFAQKEQLITDAIVNLMEKIKEKQSEIDYLAKEHLESKQELDDVYAKRSERVPRGYDYNAQQKYRAELEEWKKSEYPKREKAIEGRISGAREDLESDLAMLNKELMSIQAKPLYALLTRENIDSVFRLTTKNEIGEEEKYTEIKSSEYFLLLKYLIRNGYIDETYSDYMTYFYEDSLSRTDKIFLRSVTDKKAKSADYPIKDPARVVQRLKPSNFDEVETLNYQLLDHILKCPTTAEHRTHFIQQIRASNNFTFIDTYLDNTREKQTLVVELNKLWPTFFAEARCKDMLSVSHQKIYSLCSLYYSEKDAILAVNLNGELASYISESSDYLNIESPDIKRLEERFKLLEVRFSRINYDVSNKELFKMVYENGYYVLNFENILLFLNKEFGVLDLEEVRHRATTHILSMPDSALANKIKSNMSAYLDIAIAECQGLISDDEDIAIQVLNDKLIDIEKKKAYIKLLATEVRSLEKIEEQGLWGGLISDGNVEYSEKNILDYFLYANKLDAPLVSFINKGLKELDFSTLDSPYGDVKERFFDEIVVCNQLSNTPYRQALVSLGYVYDNFDLPGLTDEKVRILIDEAIVKMTPKSLIFIRATYPQFALYYIEKNIDVYNTIMSASLFLQEELLEVLSMEIDDENKIKLLSWSNKSISIVGKNYSPRIQKHILQNNLEERDLAHLYNEYGGLDPDVQDVVLKYAISALSLIIREPSKVDPALIDTLIHASSIEADDKVSLLIADFPNIDQTIAIAHLRYLGLDEFVKIFDTQTRPRYEDTPVNRTLLNAFIARGWLYEFNEENGYLKVRRTEPKKKENTSRK